MAANMTNMTGVVSVVDLGRIAGEITDGWFGTFFLIGLFAIFFISLKGFRTPVGITVAMFFSMMASMFLLFIDWISEGTFLIMLILFAGSVLALLFIKN